MSENTPSTVNIPGYGGTGVNEAPTQGHPPYVSQDGRVRRGTTGFVPTTDEPLPQWVDNEIAEARKEEATEYFPQPWEADGDERYSRIIAVCYPNQRHWTVEGLGIYGADGWKDTGKQFQSEELARANARSLAYKTQVPHRVKEVIWRG